MDYLTIDSFKQAIARGADIKQLIGRYVERIERFDQAGPKINAVIMLNPDWQTDLEQIIAQHDPADPLYCVPVLVKDNIDVAGWPTTAGSLALADNVATRDAEVIRRIRQAGGLILAKTNLHEFAIWGETISSRLGQTKNPYDLTRTPGGSSGGTGAALAMDYGIVGLGSDTINSVRSPASANHLVGLRPTTGVISSQGVIPYSLTQDTLGPMARTVADTDLLYRVISGQDEPARLPKRVKIGVLRSFFGQHPAVLAAMERVLGRLAEQAELVELDEAFDNQYLIDQVSVHLYDLKDHLNQYLAGQAGAPVKSYDEIVASGQFHPGIKDNLERAGQLSTSHPDYRSRLDEAADWRQRLLELYDKHDLFALVYPHQQQLVCPIGGSQVGRNGVLASITGFCSLALPAGFSPADETAPLGVPIGYELLARPGMDLDLLELGKLVFDETKFVAPVTGKE